MATPEEIFAKFGSATRAEAEKGINNPHSDGGKKNAGADAAEPVADAIHPDEEKENRTAQLQERNDPLTGETKKFLTKFLQLNNIQLSIIEGDGVLNSFFTRLGLADFTDKDTLIRGLRVLKPRYHPDRNGGGDDEKIKILNGASSWIKKSYESYHPNVSAQELSPEELLRREKAVWDAKTFEDLFAVVTSFGAVYSESFQRDVPVEEWIRRMERDRQDASSFNTRSEFFYSGWSATVTRTHGIREKFVALVSQMIDENERVFMERKTTGEKEREILVNSAKTPEELCDIVASFETIHSQTLGNTSGKKWAEGMREELASALLYEDEDDLQMYWYSTATRTYGIREKFEALVLEKVRYEKSKQKARKDAKQRIKTPNSSAEDPPLKQRRASNRSKKSADKEPVVPPVAPVNATELQKEKTQPTKEELAEVKSFDELFAVLEKYDGIQGSGEFYTSERLRDIISNVRKGDRSLDPITNSKGLRGVVKRLLQEEREPYVSGEVFNQQILAEQDARKGNDTHTDTSRSERKVNPGSPEAKETVSAHGLDEAEMRERARRQASEEAVKKIDRKIKSLEEKLDEARNAAAHAEYQNASVWKRLKQTLGVTPRETDKASEAIAYKGVLNELLKLNLDRVEATRENFTPSEYKKAIAEVLQVFKTESKLKFDDAYTEATKERKGLSEKALGAFEDIGRWYNKQPLWAKVGVGAALMGGAFLSGGSLGALVAPIMARKAFGTAGMYATFDPMIEKAIKDRLESAIAKESKDIAEKLGESEIPIELLKSKLQREIDELDQNFLRRKRERLARKASIALFAGAIGFGSTFFSHASEAAEAKDIAKGAGSAVTAVVESENTAPAMGAGTVAREQLDRASRVGVDGNAGVASAPTGVATEAAKATVEAPVATVESPTVPVADNLNIYEVSKGDTVDGLIGSYLSEHYQNFDGMTDGQKTHAINALERQLRHLSPEQLKLAGIGSGNIHDIQVKELIDLDKLFSAGDADKVMGKAAKISAEAVKNIEANDAKIAEWAAKNPGVPINEVTIENQILHPHAGVASDAAHGTRIQLSSRGFTGVPADYLPNADNSTTVTNLQNELRNANVKIDMLHQGYEELKHLPRAENWSSQIFGIAPNESLGTSAKTFDQIKDIRIFDIRNDVEIIQENRAIYGDSQEIKGVAGEKTGLLGWQLKNFTDFSNSKDGALKLSTYMSSLPYETQKQLTLGDYIKHVTPLVKQGDRLGASGLFTTSM